MLGKAITLVESRRADHQEAAQELLVQLLPDSGKAHRIGITGVPGAGKSTFIDALGSSLTAGGHRVAVLAVDPSSSRTQGSILGDKTRMQRLSVDEHAFIRPSPSAGVLGGVARATREAIVIVEAAGYDVVLIETVGVGQSETVVANMVDTFMLLALARTGDTLQGIKKGVIELADLLVVNKADGAHVREAESAASELRAALHLVNAGSDGWDPPVLTCSSIEGTGLDAVWKQLTNHRDHLERTGALARKRSDQARRWMWSAVDDQLVSRFRATPGVKTLAAELEAKIDAGTLTPTAAAKLLLANDGSLTST